MTQNLADRLHLEAQAHITRSAALHLANARVQLKDRLPDLCRGVDRSGAVLLLDEFEPEPLEKSVARPTSGARSTMSVSPSGFTVGVYGSQLPAAETWTLL